MINQEKKKSILFKGKQKNKIKKVKTKKGKIKKINLLGAGLKYKKIENNVIKMLLLFILAFFIFIGYQFNDLRIRQKDTPNLLSIEENISTLENSIKEIENKIEFQKENIKENQKGFPYKEIINFFAKKTPEGVIILEIFNEESVDEKDALIVRGITEEHMYLAQMINLVKDDFETENVEITQLKLKDEGQLFELKINLM